MRPLPAGWYPLAFGTGLAGMLYVSAWRHEWSALLGGARALDGALLAGWLAAFALGSRALGPGADRDGMPLRRAARSEWLAAFGALLSLALLAALSPAAPALAGLFGPAPASLPSSALAALLVCGLPAAAMGALLPALARQGGRAGELPASALGLVAACLALGGAAGGLLANLLLIDLAGVRATLLTGVAIQALTGAAGLALARSQGSPGGDPQPARMAAAAPAAAGKGDRVSAGLLPLTAAVACAGLGGGALYSIWGRFIPFVADPSALGLHLLTVVCLAAGAAGAALGALLAARSARPVLLFGAACALAGLAAALAPRLLPLQASGSSPAVAGAAAGLLPWILRQGAAAGALAFLPSLLLGTLPPLALRSLSLRGRGTAAGAGALLAAGAVACAAGLLLAAPLLVPAVGMVSALGAGSVLLGLAGSVALAGAGELARGRLAAAIAALLLVLGGRGLVPGDATQAVLRNAEPSASLLHFREGAVSTVTVHGDADIRTLRVDGLPFAGTDVAGLTTEKLLAHLPAIVHGSPRTALVAGPGDPGGVTRALLLHPLERVDLLNVEPAIGREGPQFAPGAADAPADPRVRSIPMESRLALRAGDSTYDLLILRTLHPASAGGAPSWSREALRDCAARLSPDGLLCAAVPLLGLMPGTLDTILATFQEVFPHATLWMPNNVPPRHVLLLAHAGESAVSIRWDALQTAFAREEVLRDLAEVNLSNAGALLDVFALDREALASLGASARVHRDDRPVLATRGSRLVMRDADILATNIERVAAVRSRVFPRLEGVAESGMDPAQVERALEIYYEATTSVLRGLAQEVRGVSGAPEAAYRAALALNPDDLDAAFLLQERSVRSAALAQTLAADPTDRESRARLARLHLAQGRFQEALEELERLGPPEERDAATWYDIGVCQARLGAATEAQRAYEKAIELDPRLPEPHVNLGVLCQKQGRYEQAVEHYQAALRLQPNHPEANYNLGVAFAGKGLNQDALPYLKKAVEMRPTYHDAFFSLGVVQATLGDLPAAVAAWERALTLNPQNQQARANIARARQIIGQTQP